MNEWIKIEDKKPPNGIYVLTALYDSRPKVKMTFIQIAERINEDWFYANDGVQMDGNGRTVTHWMPLPDKPKN